MTKALADQTPVEIDTQLAEIFRRGYDAESIVKQQKHFVDDLQQGLDKFRAGILRYSSYTAERVAKCQADLDAAKAAAAVIWAERTPFDAEFTRRGGWTRFFLVTNNTGHVHSSMRCGTCHWNTQFEWLPTYSSMTEAELVGIAGEEACTTCFSSAPVDQLKKASRITSYGRAERDATRAAARAIKEAKAAKTRAAAISNPDGTVLVARYGGAIMTERVAEQEAVSARESLISDDARDEAPDAWRLEWREEYNDFLDQALAALAHKRGTDVEAQRAIVEIKALAKFVKGYGDLVTDEHRATLKALRAAAK